MLQPKLCHTPNERHQSWPKHEQTNNHCACRRYEHGPRGYVLGLTCERVEFGRGHICQELKRSVESFGCPD